MEKSKIISVTNEPMFSPESGVTLYPALVIMENGDSGTCYMKKFNEYMEGDEVFYEKVGNKIKIKSSAAKSTAQSKQAFRPKGGSKNPEDYLGFIYGYAKDIHIAEIQVTKKSVPIEELKKNVEIMYAHLQELLLIK
jgi:hypothetical protein